MRRPLLLTIVALGAVITLAGLGGVFAVFTDRATTGTNSVGSAERAKAADLKVADGGLENGPTNCGQFSDDLATGLITVSDVAVSGTSFGYPGDYLCLRNDGSEAVNVAITAIDLADVDTACTGDEATVDITCGDNQTGELSSQLSVDASMIACDGTAFLGRAAGVPVMLSTLASPATFNEPGDGAAVSIAPGATVCVSIYFTYDPSAADALVSQSDTATWRWAFDATAS